VEPCVFCHFATHNIRSASLKDAINSPLFRSIRGELPSYKNLLRPCIVIDKPETSRKVIAQCKPYFTHEGAELIYTELADRMNEYSREYGVIADSLREKYFPEWKE